MTNWAKRIRVVALFAGLASAAAWATSGPAPALAASSAVSVVGRSAIEVRLDVTADRVLGLVNKERERGGCDPVHAHPALERAAEEHSEDMAERGRLTHTGTGGLSVAERLRDSGYRNEYFGENLARGSLTARSVVNSWMHSPAHREIILTCLYEEAGVGIALDSDGPWWTVILGAAHP
ncbi:CAP domain-containing protein [Streptomyces sp. SCSIO 30461]|uniref:CAP domain-containing protein n=1 Tax=Streptomyces sp. SCSIO 30461 TaxID=3118085 RepID=UPI0030D0AB9A